MSGVTLVRVSEQPIVQDVLEGAVRGDAHGALVVFAGIVRDHDGGRAVTALEYTAHPDAEAVLRACAERIAAAHPEVAIAAEHRIGPLRIGEAALVCAVASAHRAVAFSACAALVDEIKAVVPIWKEQRFADGTSEWVGIA